MTSRKKPGVAFWAAVAAVAILVGYPLSFGPACWWSSRCREADNDRDNSSGDIEPRAPQAYWPPGWIVVHGPRPIGTLIIKYASSMAPGTYVSTDASGSFWIRL